VTTKIVEEHKFLIIFQMLLY